MCKQSCSNLFIPTQSLALCLSLCLLSLVGGHLLLVHGGLHRHRQWQPVLHSELTITSHFWSKKKVRYRFPFRNFTHLVLYFTAPLVPQAILSSTMNWRQENSGSALTPTLNYHSNSFFHQSLPSDGASQSGRACA